MDMPLEIELTVTGLTVNSTPNRWNDVVFEAMASEDPE
jgi:hypothetical protein